MTKQEIQSIHQMEHLQLRMNNKMTVEEEMEVYRRQ
jgi:hypothetical protein